MCRELNCIMFFSVHGRVRYCSVLQEMQPDPIAGPLIVLCSLSSALSVRPSHYLVISPSYCPIKQQNVFCKHACLVLHRITNESKLVKHCRTQFSRLPTVKIVYIVQ